MSHEPAAGAGRLPGQAMRVLMWEPNPHHAELLARMLAGAGMDVHQVQGSTELGRRRQAAPWDLVLLGDVDAPHAELFVLPGPPVMVATARGEAHAAHLLAQGAAEVMVKEAGFERVLPVVARLAVLRAEGARAPKGEPRWQERVQDLEQRLMHATAQRSQVLSYVSHELRTPLTTILGFSGVLSEGAGGPLNPDQLRHVKLIQDSASQLLGLINDLLDLARLESGQASLLSTPVRMRALALDVAEALREAIPSAQVEVLTDGAERVIQADANRMRQILWNTGLFALRNAPQGRVEMGVRPMETGPEVIVVTCHGLVLEPEELPRLFEKFYELPAAATRTHYRAAGMGLVLAADLAKAMGGRLVVRGRNGGTEFRLSVGEGAAFSLPT